VDDADAEAVGFRGVAAAESAAPAKNQAVADADRLSAVAGESDVSVRAAEAFRFRERGGGPVTVFRVAHGRRLFASRIERARERPVRRARHDGTRAKRLKESTTTRAHNRRV
jgi:hypothetical protein